jgi:hypothetical protein
MKYNITKHAKERWIQRVVPTAGEDAETQIQRAFEKAEYIGDEGDKSFYINSDHWVFCTDSKKLNIITVYEADYGFAQDINRNIAESLLKKIRKAKDELEKARIKKDESLLGLTSAKNKLINEIELKQAEINKIEAMEREIEANYQIRQKEHDGIFKQLIDSLAYRRELLLLKNIAS